MWLDKFLTSNETIYRLLRTILQGIFGVLVANLDVIVGSFNIPATVKPMIVAGCMAILSPIMSELGRSHEEKKFKEFADAERSYVFSAKEEKDGEKDA